jgi:spermidine synthase
MTRTRSAPRAPRAGSTPSRSADRLPVWAIACFLCSGAAGLLYEVVWSKQLSYLLGSSHQSVSTVVAAFLGGLALGARTLGARLARRPDTARMYALLEVGVAVLGLLLLPALRSLDGPVGQLYRGLGGEGVAFAGARVVLLLVLLVPPAALMGATLPVLVAHCERGALGAGLARLYAINTFGAVAGSVLGGYLLLPGVGLFATTLVAAALNLVAALLAWRSPAGRAEGRARPAADAGPVTALLGGAPRVVFAILFGVSGFAALLLQLAWVRLFGLVLGSSVYSFSAVLGIYLLGLGIGSAAIAPILGRGRVAAWWFAMLQLGIAAASAIGMHAYASLPRAMLELGQRAGASWIGLVAGEILLVLPIALVPCLLLGATFPLATRLLQRGAAGPTTGAAYAVNTLGTIAGSLAAGFALLPAIGVQGVVSLAAGLALLAGAGALLLPGTSPPDPRPARVPGRALAVAGVLAAVAVGAALAVPRWDPLLMSLGTYRPFYSDNLVRSFRSSGGAGDPTRATVAGQRVLYYHDGINASVLVASDQGGSRTWMRVGGKVDASTGDMLTQVLLGLIPAAFAEPGARTLIVGHGSGFTAAAALAAGVGETEIAELEPAVITGSRLFHREGGDPLDDPRVTLHLEDARTRLAHGEGRYGLVISEPSNPWIAGVNNLFTEEFYARVRRRLLPDGVFCQWIQLYELSPATFQSLLASFVRVFPDAHLFCIWSSADALLIAAPPGKPLSLERLRAPEVRPQLAHARLVQPEQVAAFYVGSGAEVHALAAGGERNTDDRPYVEYRAPRDMIEIGRGHGSRHPGITSRLGLPVVPAAGNPIEAWPRESVLLWRARQRLTSADPQAALAVIAELGAAGVSPDSLEGALRRALAGGAGTRPGAEVPALR